MVGSTYSEKEPPPPQSITKSTGE